jgi:hypothetical protein
MMGLAGLNFPAWGKGSQEGIILVFLYLILSEITCPIGGLCFFGLVESSALLATYFTHDSTCSNLGLGMMWFTCFNFDATASLVCLCFLGLVK